MQTKVTRRIALGVLAIVIVLAIATGGWDIYRTWDEGSEGRAYAQWQQKTHRELYNFVIAYIKFARSHDGVSPSSLEDLEEEIQGEYPFPLVAKMIREGQLIVVWDAVITESAEENDKYWLAYESWLGERGGRVLSGAGWIFSAGPAPPYHPLPPLPLIPTRKEQKKWPPQ